MTHIPKSNFAEYADILDEEERLLTHALDCKMNGLATLHMLVVHVRKSGREVSQDLLDGIELEEGMVARYHRALHNRREILRRERSAQ